MSVVTDLIINGNMSADISSAAFRPQRNYGFTIQATFTTTGSLGGVLKIQISLDEETWDDLEDSAQTLTDAGSFAWIVKPVNSFVFCRLAYVAAEGDSGILNAKRS